MLSTSKFEFENFFPIIRLPPRKVREEIEEEQTKLKYFSWELDPTSLSLKVLVS